MKKCNLIFVVLLVLLLSLGMVACNKGGNSDGGSEQPAAIPSISVSGLSGNGTEANPYLLSVVNGSKSDFTPSISLEGYEFTVTATSGASNVEITVASGVVSVKGKSVGDATVKVAINNESAAVYVKVTITAKPVTAVTFPDLDEGSGTLAAPYVVTLRGGFSAEVPYLLAPSSADDKVVTWTVGTITDGAFNAATDRGVTAVANEANNAVTFSAAADATLGATVCKMTVGSVTSYVQLNVADLSERTSWSRSGGETPVDTFTTDWLISADSYNSSNADGLELLAAKSATNTFNVTAAKSAIIVRAKAISGNLSAIKVYANGTALNPLMGGTTYYINNNRTTGLIYDLSSYVGQKVTVKVENVGENALVVTTAELFEMDNVATERTTWEKADIISDWGIKGAADYRSGTGEGFDLNTYDSEGFEYIYNTIAVTAENARMTVKVRRFGQDNGNGAMVMLMADGTAITPIGYEYNIACVEDTDGLSSYLVYDLSKYVGNTIRVIFALTNDRIGHLVIQSIALSAFDKTASELTSWNKDSIVSDWNITYAADYRSGVGEGFDLNTNDNDANEFIYNYVPVTAANAKMLIKVRRFGQDNGNENKCLVFADGNLLVPYGYANGKVVIYDTDGNYTQLLYDLTDYIGKTVQLAVMQPVPSRGHLVVSSIAMTAWSAETVSELSSWDKSTIISDWNITYAADYRDGVGEGFDFNTNDDDANEFIYNTVAVSADKTQFEIKVRRFAQDDEKVNAVGVLVNGELLIANGQTNGYVAIEDTDGDVTTLTYDFSEYVGENVQIVVIQPIPNCGHLVLMGMEFKAAATE